jgi:hypothetical protein
MTALTNWAEPKQVLITNQCENMTETRMKITRHHSQRVKKEEKYPFCSKLPSCNMSLSSNHNVEVIKGIKSRNAHATD